MKENDPPIDLCMEVLKRLDNAGVLQSMILIGSWCVHFYKSYFPNPENLPALRTRDMDFLIDTPPKFRSNVDVAELLKDLGFVVDLLPKGHMRLGHPELIIDFLVPEKGRGGNEPYKVAALGINAQPLRYLNFLAEETIAIKVNDLHIKLAHPTRFALHKFIISDLRVDKAKAARDQTQAVEVLRAVLQKDGIRQVAAVWNTMPKKWHMKVMASLKKIDAVDDLVALTARDFRA